MRQFLWWQILIGQRLQLQHHMVTSGTLRSDEESGILLPANRVLATVRPTRPIRHRAGSAPLNFVETVMQRTSLWM